MSLAIRSSRCSARVRDLNVSLMMSSTTDGGLVPLGRRLARHLLLHNLIALEAGLTFGPLTPIIVI